jgi:hypothetical protein
VNSVGSPRHPSGSIGIAIASPKEKRDREAKLQAEVERLRKELGTKRSTPVPAPAPAPKIDKAVIDKAVASTAKHIVAARDREWKKAVSEYTKGLTGAIRASLSGIGKSANEVTFSPPPEIDLSADAAETLKVIQADHLRREAASCSSRRV